MYDLVELYSGLWGLIIFDSFCCIFAQIWCIIYYNNQYRLREQNRLLLKHFILKTILTPRFWPVCSIKISLILIGDINCSVLRRRLTTELISWRYCQCGGSVVLYLEERAVQCGKSDQPLHQLTVVLWHCMWWVQELWDAGTHADDGQSKTVDFRTLHHIFSVLMVLPTGGFANCRNVSFNTLFLSSHALLYCNPAESLLESALTAGPLILNLVVYY